MHKKMIGQISKTVKRLCARLCLMEGSEDEFKQGLRQLRVTTSPHTIALSLQKYILEFCSDNPERIWTLADQVDPSIRNAWNAHNSAFNR